MGPIFYERVFLEKPQSNLTSGIVMLRKVHYSNSANQDKKKVVNVDFLKSN